MVHHRGQEERQVIEVGTSGAHIARGELVSIHDEAEGKSTGEDMVTVKRERVEQLVEEEEAEEAEADAKKQKEKVLGQRRAIPNEEAEQGRSLQHMQPPGANPYKPLWNPRMSAKSRARRSPHRQLHQIAPRWNRQPPTGLDIRGNHTQPHLCLNLPMHVQHACLSGSPASPSQDMYVCKPCQTRRKGCKHLSCKRARSASHPPPPLTAPPSSTMTPARGRSSTRLQTGTSPPASPSQSEPPAKRQRRQSSSHAKTPTKTSTTPSRSMRAHAHQASPQRRPVMRNATSNPPPCNLPTVIILPLKMNGELALGATGGF